MATSKLRRRCLCGSITNTGLHVLFSKAVEDEGKSCQNAAAVLMSQ